MPSVLSGKVNPILREFFKFTLLVKDVSWKDLVGELETIQQDGQEVVDNIQDIYYRLQALSSSMDLKDLKKLR